MHWTSWKSSSSVLNPQLQNIAALNSAENSQPFLSEKGKL